MIFFWFACLFLLVIDLCTNAFLEVKAMLCSSIWSVSDEMVPLMPPVLFSNNS